MNSRIVEVRKTAKLTQEQFAKKVKISTNYVTLIETGRKNPGDRLISDICREFNINEEWLRTGTGEMYDLPEDETAAIVSDLLEEDNPFYDIIKGIMKTYQGLDEKSQKILLDFSEELLENLKKGGN